VKTRGAIYEKYANNYLFFVINDVMVTIDYENSSEAFGVVSLGHFSSFESHFSCYLIIKNVSFIRLNGNFVFQKKTLLGLNDICRMERFSISIIKVW